MSKTYVAASNLADYGIDQRGIVVVERQHAKPYGFQRVVVLIPEQELVDRHSNLVDRVAEAFEVSASVVDVAAIPEGWNDDDAAARRSHSNA